MKTPDLDTSPTSENETKREKRTRIVFTWIVRILSFGLAFRKK